MFSRILSLSFVFCATTGQELCSSFTGPLDPPAGYQPTVENYKFCNCIITAVSADPNTTKGYNICEENKLKCNLICREAGYRAPCANSRSYCAPAITQARAEQYCPPPLIPADLRTDGNETKWEVGSFVEVSCGLGKRMENAFDEYYCRFEGWRHTLVPEKYFEQYGSGAAPSCVICDAEPCQPLFDSNACEMFTKECFHNSTVLLQECEWVQDVMNCLSKIEGHNGKCQLRATESRWCAQKKEVCQSLNCYTPNKTEENPAELSSPGTANGPSDKKPGGVPTVLWIGVVCGAVLLLGAAVMMFMVSKKKKTAAALPSGGRHGRPPPAPPGTRAPATDQQYSEGGYEYEYEYDDAGTEYDEQ